MIAPGVLSLTETLKELLKLVPCAGLIVGVAAAGVSEFAATVEFPGLQPHNAIASTPGSNISR
jgi:hypothetical protein